MKVLQSWMQRFAPIEGTPEHIAEQLTNLGLVVEEIHIVGASLDGVVVAEVLELAPHPEADRIQLVQVDPGTGQALQICCGAFNMAVGDRVPLATIGTVLPGGLEIAPRKMRGQDSQGMLCSATELELGADSEGIMILDASLVPGTPLQQALSLETDILFDLEVEGNRPDALSIAGVTRDLAAALGVPFAIPSPLVTETAGPDGENAADLASITIADFELCPRFGIRILDDVTVGPSPEWLRHRLEASGMRSINTVVDISNLVMLELGQPNHTYDLAKVPDGVLGVRWARDGEALVTLDGQRRVLTPADGVITNAADEPIGLAGVMGGESTEISDTTTSVLLEGAVWHRMSIARTSRRLNLRSEASNRFERGVDHAAIERALDRFCELAIDLCGATIRPGIVMAQSPDLAPVKIPVRPEKVRTLLGADIADEQMIALLEPIGFDAFLEDGLLQITIPSWRPDSTIEADVVEEIGRHYGYHNIPRRVPRPTQSGGLTQTQQNRRQIRRALVGAGLAEAMPLPFVAPADLDAIGFTGTPIALSNPLVHEESVLRTSLLPGLLKVVAANQARNNRGIRLFELGHVFLPELDERGELPQQPERLGMIWAGADAPDMVRVLWRVLDSIGVSAQSQLRNLTAPDADPGVFDGLIGGLHPYRSAEIVLRGRRIGGIGEVHPSVAARFDTTGRIGWAELNLAPLLDAMTSTVKMQPISMYPPSEFDLALVVADDIPADQVQGTLRKAGGSLVTSIVLFDVYRSGELGDGLRSLTYRIRLQASDHTLEEAEIKAVRRKMLDQVASRLKAHLRA